MSSVYEVINPATEKAVTQVALADVAQTDLVIEKATWVTAFSVAGFITSYTLLPKRP